MKRREGSTEHTHRAACSSGSSGPKGWSLPGNSCHLSSHCYLGSLDKSIRVALIFTAIPSLSKVRTLVLILSLYRKYSPACYDYRSA